MVELCVVLTFDTYLTLLQVCVVDEVKLKVNGGQWKVSGWGRRIA